MNFFRIAAALAVLTATASFAEGKQAACEKACKEDTDQCQKICKEKAPPKALTYCTKGCTDVEKECVAECKKN